MNSVVDDAIIHLKSVVSTVSQVATTLRRRPNSARATSAAHLFQIVRDLLKNAIQSTTGITGRDAVIEVRTLVTTQSPRVVTLTVTDNGTGIQPDLINRVFEDGFSTKRGKGRGHGLYIVREVVHECGGTITLLNLYGRTPRNSRERDIASCSSDGVNLHDVSCAK